MGEEVIEREEEKVEEREKIEECEERERGKSVVWKGV